MEGFGGALRFRGKTEPLSLRGRNQSPRTACEGGGELSTSGAVAREGRTCWVYKSEVSSQDSLLPRKILNQVSQKANGSSDLRRIIRGYSINICGLEG